MCEYFVQAAGEVRMGDTVKPPCDHVACAARRGLHLKVLGQRGREVCTRKTEGEAFQQVHCGVR